MKETIINAAARALYVCAYADAVENGEIEGEEASMGADWMDVAPETPQDAILEAAELIGRIVQLNGMCIEAIGYQAAKADGLDGSTCTDEYWDTFGHYLAMQSLGHGVSWFDDHEEFPLELPYIEYYL